MAVADKHDKKIEAATLPQKTKDQRRKFLDNKEITDTQFKQILERVLAEYQSTRIEACEAVGDHRGAVYRGARHADDDAYVPLRGCR